MSPLSPDDEVPARPSDDHEWVAPTPAALPPTEPIFSPKRVLMAAIPLMAVVGFLGGIAYTRATHVPAMPVNKLLTVVASRSNVARQLDPTFADANGDLVADLPAEAAKLVDPDPLVFSYVASEDPAKARETWKSFMDHLAMATGKKVEYLADVRGTDAQLSALKDGRLHVTGFNTGSVPAAVNGSGFVPVCVLADDDGSYSYEMEIIVPADSPIRSPEDLRGGELVFTDTGSNSGFKAPLVMLRDEFGLEPERDYAFKFSRSHDASIRGVAGGQYRAAAVANDMLKRSIRKGDIQEPQVRSIYKSKGFPPACLGYAHDLTPELAAKVRAAFLDFSFKGSSLEDAFGAARQTRFAPVSYKDQWNFVRFIDESMERIRGAK